MTGFIVTCEERSYIKNSSSCDMTMKFNVSDFEWPDDPRVLQAKLFEWIRLAVHNFVLFCFLTILFYFNLLELLFGQPLEKYCY